MAIEIYVLSGHVTLTWVGQAVAATRDIIAGMQVSKSFLVDYLVVSVSVPLGISGSLKYQKQNSEFLVLLHEFHRGEACLLLSQQTNNQLTELPRKGHSDLQADTTQTLTATFTVLLPVTP